MVEWVLIAGAVATAFIALARGLQLLIATLRRLAERIDAIGDLAEAQLTRNGGGSLVDRVNGIPTIIASVQEHGTILHRMEARVDRIEACLKKTHEQQSA